MNMNRNRNRDIIPYNILATSMLYGSIAIGVFLTFFLPIVVCRSTADEIEVTVVKTENTIHDGYLIFTDKETFKITDSVPYWRWNSSDVYGNIHVGKTYHLKVYGWRIHFLSMYRNIISASEK